MTARAAPQWETSKENYVPLKSGRVIPSTAPTSPSNRSSTLASMRAEAAHPTTDSDRMDPLAPHCRLAKWALQAYPRGDSAHSPVLAILETATDSFKDANRYKDDDR
jgi:hypothetical protein